MTEIRKIVTRIETTYADGGRQVDPPTRKCVVAAVIANPFAGTYVEDLSPLYDVGDELGARLGKIAVKTLGIEANQVHSYGKAVLVGSSGELEHAAALMHPKLGKGLRSVVGGGKALIPSSKKMGAAGQVLDVPLGHKDAAYVRSHFDAIEVWISDAPRSDELMLAVAVTDSGRPHARVGGLTTDEVVGDDGLR